MQISPNKVVTIHYTLRNPEGEILDSSTGGEPFSYLHGAGNIIPGLEKALEGKQAGDQVNVTIAPEDAYGEHDEALVQAVPRAAFQGVDDIQPGMQFQAQGQGGAPQVVTVTEVAEDTVTVDANHPLAGVTLIFEVEVKDVREASEEEVAHGHVHA